MPSANSAAAADDASGHFSLSHTWREITSFAGAFQAAYFSCQRFPNMRNIKMTSSPRYPFSDLTLTEVERLIQVARVERGQAVRNFIVGLFHVRRQREAQAWPAGNEPALSLKPYC